MRTTCALCGARLRERQCPECGWNGYAATDEARAAPKIPPGPTLEDVAKGSSGYCLSCGDETGTCECVRIRRDEGPNPYRLGPNVFDSAWKAVFLIGFMAGIVAAVVAVYEAMRP